MAVRNNEPDRFETAGISHNLTVTRLDAEDGLGTGVLFNIRPFGSATMNYAEMVALAHWLIAGLPGELAESEFA